MIFAIIRIWHHRRHHADKRWLAARLGPHLARDIGIGIGIGIGIESNATGAAERPSSGPNS